MSALADEAKKNSILIVAGEASSANYALRLMEEARAQGLQIDFFGIGTDQMEKAGFRRVAKAEDIAVVGLTEVFHALGQILKAMKQVVAEAERVRPKAVILMDLPDFNFRIAPKLKKLGLPVIYYISPQVWAWRQNRVYQMKEWAESILVLFKFEEKFYLDRGVQAEFVGHPLLEELTPDLYQGPELMERRQRFGLNAKRPILGLMPGSRRGEIQHHLHAQIQAASLLKKRQPELEVVLLVAPTLNTDWLKAQLPPLDFPLKLIQKSPFEMISICDTLLAASGTATLMVGLLEKPMVIMYKASPFTVWFATTFLIKQPRFFGLSNIILDEMASQELFQDEATPERMADELEPLLFDPVKSEQQKAKLRRLKDLLGGGTATKRVLEVVKRYLR